jgi:glycosyltransferase involved in cell wall biosynthesis
MPETSEPTNRPTCAVVSFRLGLSDGVSIVAAAWQRALATMGWQTITVAGEGVADRLIPALAIDGPAMDHDALVALVADAVADADVVLVENLLSIPMNLAASRAVAQVLAGRPAVLHHHDPSWQRDRFAHITELPPDDPSWRHVTINRMTERQFAERSMAATTIYNGFDTSPPPGDRLATREILGISDGDRLFAHPVRAIARKNIPAAVRLCEQLGATYWLPNPAEEGYDDELDRVLGQASCPIVQTRLADRDLTVSDLYAAADLVLFPSTWEGFGNPPVEAAIHRRPVTVGHYPVAEELRELGFRWLDPDDPAAIDRTLRQLAERSPAEEQTLEHNHRIATTHLSVEKMTEEMRSVFEPLGWNP